jgi:hypothetical protein
MESGSGWMLTGNVVRMAFGRNREWTWANMLQERVPQLEARPCRVRRLGVGVSVRWRKSWTFTLYE